MSLNLNISANTVYTFKLMTGEEIIAKVVEVNDSTVTISTPLHIAIITSASGQPSMQLMPALFSAEGKTDVVLNLAGVVMAVIAREDVSDSWFETATGIAPVKKRIITG